MKISRILALICLSVVLGFACSDTGQKEKPKAPFDVDRWVGEWVTMWNSYDLNEVDRLFIGDERLTYLSSEKEGALRGIEAIREHHRGFGFVEGGKEQPNKLWVDGLVTSDLGGTAVVAGIWYFQRPDGPLQRGPMTIVYLWESEQYHIVHMHFANYLDSE
jgi:hypothetical protein